VFFRFCSCFSETWGENKSSQTFDTPFEEPTGGESQVFIYVPETDAEFSLKIPRVYLKGNEKM
jgi:hypothetical protein